MDIEEIDDKEISDTMTDPLKYQGHFDDAFMINFGNYLWKCTNTLLYTCEYLYLYCIVARNV
jgi:hypothetical protein